MPAWQEALISRTYKEIRAKRAMHVPELLMISAAGLDHGLQPRTVEFWPLGRSLDSLLFAHALDDHAASKSSCERQKLQTMPIDKPKHCTTP